MRYLFFIHDIGEDAYKGLDFEGDSMFVKKILLRYDDGYKISYDIHKSPVEAKLVDDHYIYHLMIQFDSKHFHFSDSYDRYEGVKSRAYTSPVYVDIGHYNLIDRKPVWFRIPDAHNTFGVWNVKMDVDVIVKKDKIKVIAKGPETYGTYLISEK